MMCRVIPCLLALVLALTAIASGALKAQAGAAGQLVICTGAGVERILVDEDGQPVTPHHCPDCVLLVVAEPAPALHFLGESHGILRDHHSAEAATQPCPVPAARGPPISVI